MSRKLCIEFDLDLGRLSEVVSVDGKRIGRVEEVVFAASVGSSPRLVVLGDLSDEDKKLLKSRFARVLEGETDE